MTPPAPEPQPSAPAEAKELRGQTADYLRTQAAMLAAEALDGLETPASDEADRAILGASLVRLLSESVRVGRSDARSTDLIGLAASVDRLGLSPADLFSAVYRITAAALRLPGAGATPNAPLVADYLHRASFDLLAAWTTRALELPTAPAITDDLTMLHTRAMFDTVLAKECQRAERFEHWVSILLIEVTDLADINRTRGYGVGDQVLERMGILIRRYFRQHDWVAHYRENAVAVLLPETGPDDARTLAGLMRAMIQERLAVDDEGQRPVTVSVAIASARPLNGYPVDPDRLLEELDAALERTAEGDGGKIESVEVHPVIDIGEPEIGSKESGSM